MEQVDFIVKCGWVVPGAGMQPLRDGAVAVQGDCIKAVGRAEHVLEKYLSSGIVERPSGMVVPGLFNTHTHIPMTLFRGLADDLPLKRWLEDHIFPAEARLTPEHVKLGAELACAEMIRCGVTSFIDMYLFEDVIAGVVDRAGLRAWLGEGLFDFPSPAFDSGFDALEATSRMMEKWSGHERITITVDPHTPYTCSPELLSAAARLADEQTAIIKIHVAETEWENSEIQRRHGRSPVALLDDLGLLGERTVMAHCVCLSESDMDLMAARGVSVSHCPESNLKLASGIAPVPAMLERKINVTLGTDGAASNNDLDILGEMDCAAKIHKGIAHDPVVVSAPDVLAMVTSNAAAAVGRADLGIIAPGAKADMAILDLDAPHMRPCLNPVSQLVYSARGGDVVDLVVNGSFIMENRKILTLDEKEIFDRVEKMVSE
jgi:5-methylthioadenosine/S-adenosylhomocysteine deaminase